MIVQNKMSFEILNSSFIGKCRICLNVEEEMNPLFEPVYEAQEENESIFISIADVLKSVSNIVVTKCLFIVLAFSTKSIFSIDY